MNTLPYKRAVMPRQDMYARPDTRVEYQLFGSEYFSNADVKLYFGDIWVDEITNINFSLSEQVMPIFGYSSYTYDAVARGKRIIQGQFSLNYTSSGYLHQILENANAIYYAIEKGEKDGKLQPQYYENLKLSEILHKLGKNSFEQVADEYEQAIWGAADDTKTYLNYSDRSYFRQDTLGFDIRVQYGAVSESQGYIQNLTYERTRNMQPNMTVDVLNGVQLNGMAKSIATSDQGSPIQEQYSFFARDLNGISLANLKRAKDAKINQERVQAIYNPAQGTTTV